MSAPLSLRDGPGQLEAAQRWLLQRVTRRLPGPRDHAEDVRWVLGGKLSSSQRVAVYQRAYFGRLVECLRDDYPALAQAMGAHEFEARCLAFIEAHPPASSSLNGFGAAFADFCAIFCATEPPPQAAFWCDLARLEWAIVECIHADADSCLDARELVALSEAQWDRAWLEPSAAARVLDLRHPVHDHHRALLSGGEPGPLAPSGSTTVVCRRGDRVYRFGVEPRWVGLLRRLVSGEPLASAVAAASLEVAGAGDEAGAEGLQRAVSEWVRRGVFSRVRVDRGVAIDLAAPRSQPPSFLNGGCPSSAPRP